MSRPTRPNPAGVYGRSKLEGEAAVAAANPRHLILRTAWLYAPYGTEFPAHDVAAGARAAAAARRGRPARAIPPTRRIWRDAILAIAARLATASSDEAWGIYHAAAGGETTWAGFAAAIVAAGARLGVPQVPVIPITTAEYPTPAKRPANSRLDCSKLERTFGVRLPPWQQGVPDASPSWKRSPP